MWLKRKCFTDLPSLFFSNFSADDYFQAEHINSQLRSHRRRSNPVCDQQQVIARKTSLKFSNRNQSPLTDEENLIESSADQSSKRSSRSSRDHPLPSTSANDEPTEITSITPPLPPERHDSLYLSASEERDLRQAPWFQAGIPREITLEILAQQAVGSFMVRESTSKPGCFALSLRVPREFHGNGIAHYLILRTYKGGFKIKGFTKEFNTLSALITHHSVMSELLPCPLSLSRRHLTFRKHERDDFVDINGNSECRIFSGFRKISTDVNACV